jgi:Fic family protein
VPKPSNKGPFGPMSQRLGTFVDISASSVKAKAFLPPPLPPKPAIHMERLFLALELANRALGRLDGVTSILPDASIFLYMYVRKEALLSSQIEGTQSSLSELLLFESAELPGVPLDDVQEVSNYVAAINHGVQRIRDGFPISLRLIREIHAVLMSKGRGSTKQPGEFRATQNWIGGSGPHTAIFVPPPPDRMMKALGELESFIHEETPELPFLVKLGLIHVQFETIHPFLDGNGRLGRLLITLILCSEKILNQPMLYLSLYFKAHRQRYYDLLQSVRERGDWESWLEFFLNGISEMSTIAAESAEQILSLFVRDRAAIELLGRPASSALRVYQIVQKKQIITISMCPNSLTSQYRPSQNQFSTLSI